jgi:hypothetical protein
MREVERNRLDPRRFIADIVAYAEEVIHSGDATASLRLGRYESGACW